MTRSPTNSDDRRTTTGVVGYDLAQSYDTAKTLLLYGLVFYVLGATTLSNFEPSPGLPPLPEAALGIAAVVALLGGLFMAGFSSLVVIRYIRAIGVTHYVRSAVPV